MEGIASASRSCLDGPGSNQKEISRKAAKTAKNNNLFESAQSDVVHVAQVSAGFGPVIVLCGFAALREIFFRRKRPVCRSWQEGQSQPHHDC